MVEVSLIIAVFLLIGAGLKYIDEAFDEENLNKTTATILAGILLILWIGLSYLDIGSRTILLAILLGVLLTGKIDNLVFASSTALIFGSFVFVERIAMFPLIMLALTGVIDEKGNDYVDANKTHGLISFFFLHRFTMKTGLAALTIGGIFPYYYLLAFLLFDMSYDTIGYLTKSRAERDIESPLIGEPRPTTAA